MENNIPIYVHFRHSEIFCHRQIIGPNAIICEALQNRASRTTGHNKSTVFAVRCIWRRAQATRIPLTPLTWHIAILTRMPVSAMTKYALLVPALRMRVILFRNDRILEIRCDKIISIIIKLSPWRQLETCTQGRWKYEYCINSSGESFPRND